MYIRKNISKKTNGEIHTGYFLVEGYREKETGKVKQKILSNLSHLPEKTILMMKGSLKGNTPISKAKFEDLEVISNKQYGNIAIFSKLYDEYFSKYFKDNKKYNEALKIIIINKIFDPKSKNSLNNWIKEVDLKEIKNKNNLYDCLDYLEDNQDIIEKDLAKKNFTNKNNNSIPNSNNILLYDITSTYFEGKGDENICKYGYSRDHRKDRVQVNIGVITNNDGTPIAVEIINGNITDKQTLQGQIDKIKTKFNIKELTFVFDRGMKSKVNLEYLKDQGYEYITALSHSELKDKSEKNTEIQLSIFDKMDLASFEIESEEIDKKTNEKIKQRKFYSLCHNPHKAERDKINRDKLIEKTIEELKKVQNFKRKYPTTTLQDKISKKINKFKCEKYINYNIEEITETIVISNEELSKDSKKESEKDAKETKIFGKLTFTKNAEKIELDEKYDGFYMIESTNKNITGDKSRDQYKDLQLVERAFNSIKNHIEIRPVFHYKEARIKGHIFSCFMSYFLLHKFKQKIPDILEDNSLDTILTETKLIQKTTFRIDRFCFDKISNLTEIQKKILKKFNIQCCV
jgi:transposase